MLPMLRLVAAGKESIADCEPDLRQQFGISDEDASALLPSGKQTYLSNRAHWARNYLSQAGLVEAIRRGRYKTTRLGEEFLATHPASVNVETLKQFPKFWSFWPGHSPSPMMPLSWSIHRRHRARTLQRICWQMPTPRLRVH